MTSFVYLVVGGGARREVVVCDPDLGQLLVRVPLDIDEVDF